MGIRKLKATAPARPKRAPGPGLARPVVPSAALAAIVGADPLPRCDVVSKLWAHVKAHCARATDDRRIILADEALRTLAGKDRVGQMEIARLIARNVSAA